MSEQHLDDPCADFGATQRWAVVWFISIIVIGSLLTWKLSQIDRFNYDTKGRYLNYDHYRQNRLATTSIGSERQDERAASSLQRKLSPKGF